jgi:5S rRNA maturation endonuclease (ribonuclease M5)
MRLFDFCSIPYNETDTDYTTTCMWCATQDKLSVSKEEGHVFQCWYCKETGNAISLMRKFYETLPPLTMRAAKTFCVIKKGVIPQTLRSEGVKYDGLDYWFPIRNPRKDIIALHKYNTTTNITYSSPKPWNCSILGLGSLTGNKEIWVAEGHADYLVLRAVLDKSPNPPDLLGTAGSAFSSNYLYLLDSKEVVLLFDNDEAGDHGVQSISKRIKSGGHSIINLHCIDWSRITVPNHAHLPSGFDIRDLNNSLSGTP